MDGQLARFAAVFLMVLAVVEVTVPTAYSEAALHVALVLLSLVLADLVLAVLDKFLPRPLLPDLGDKAVLVTGCDSGFGHECAKRLDALGVTVYAGCLFPNNAGATALKTSSSSRLRIVPLDVTKDDSVQAAVQLVRSTIGDKVLWAVVNNAGLLGGGELHWTSMAEFQKLMDVNVIGMVRVTTAFLDMIIRAKGRVVCMGSLAGRITWTPQLAYCMTKYAVVAFADGLRRQMRKWSVSVHTVEPFFYKTNLSSEENIRSVFKRNWCSCPSEVHQMYGEKYFDFYVNSTVNMSNNLSYNNTAAVVDSMVDASVGASPKMTYTCGYFAGWIFSLFPNRIVDVTMDFMPPNGCCPAALQNNWEEKKIED